MSREKRPKRHSESLSDKSICKINMLKPSIIMRPFAKDIFVLQQGLQDKNTGMYKEKYILLHPQGCCSFNWDVTCQPDVPRCSGVRMSPRSPYHYSVFSLILHPVNRPEGQKDAPRSERWSDGSGSLSWHSENVSRQERMNDNPQSKRKSSVICPWRICIYMQMKGRMSKCLIQRGKEACWMLSGHSYRRCEAASSKQWC